MQQDASSRGRLTAARVFGGLTAAAVAFLAACSSSGGGEVDLVAATQKLTLEGVCKMVSVAPAPGVATAGTPAAELVKSSVACGDGETPAVLFSTFESVADRDSACASLAAEPTVICGTGDNLWVARGTDAGTTSRAADALGTAARRAAGG